MKILLSVLRLRTVTRIITLINTDNTGKKFNAAAPMDLIWRAIREDFNPFRLPNESTLQ